MGIFEYAGMKIYINELPDSPSDVVNRRTLKPLIRGRYPSRRWFMPSKNPAQRLTHRPMKTSQILSRISTRSTLLLRNSTSRPIPEASRRLPVELQHRHAAIDRAGGGSAGNVYRHESHGPPGAADKPNRIPDALRSLQNLPSSASLR
jgi:hypothetical protein